MYSEASLVFWTDDRKWAFQRVENIYNVYNEKGDFVCECKNFKQMNDFITEKQKQEDDLTGKQFGEWTVIRKRYDLKNTDLWLCKCVNGHKVNLTSESLYSKRNTCQYCDNKWNAAGRVKTIDGNGKRNRYFTTWCGMRDRCNNPNNPNYKNYGGRGIKVCEEWNANFQAFYSYVSSLENFGENARSLDRIDNNGDYCPGNVRWATAKEQANNKRQRKKNA